MMSDNSNFNDVSNKYFTSVRKHNQFFNYKLRSERGLIILQINAWSIDSSTKFDKFKCFLMEINTVVDVIVVCETYLTYDTASLHDLQAYVHYPACRGTHGGGLSLYINSRLKHRFCEKVDSTFFSISVDIDRELSRNDVKPLKLVAYYRPPHRINENVFLRHLQGHLENAHGSDCMVLGDINIDALKFAYPSNTTIRSGSTII